MQPLLLTLEEGYLLTAALPDLGRAVAPLSPPEPAQQPLLGGGESLSVVFNSLQPHWLYSPWNCPGQDPGMDSLSLCQGLSPTQGSNPGLPN